MIDDDFIDKLYALAEITVTPEIETELIYFSPQSWKKEKTFIIPITKKETYLRAINDGFDPADSSIFGIEDLNKYNILTEDRPLLKYGQIYRLNILFFVEFLAKLLESDIITKNELYFLNKNLFQLRNIDKKLFGKIKDFAHRF